MPTATFDLRDLPARLDELLALVAAGTEVVLADGVTPRARLLPPEVEPPPGPRILGLHARRGGYWMADDFNAELPDSFWFGDE